MSRVQRQRRAPRRPVAARARLFAELLEDRAVPSTVPMPVLALDAKNYVEGRILVRVEAGAADKACAALPGASARPLTDLVPGLMQVTLPAGTSVPEAVAVFSRQPGVLYAQPDYVVRVQLTPDDPRFTSQWALDNAGQTGGTADADIDAVEAWDRTTGNGSTLVAVIDTGIDYNHPDLRPNIWTNPGEVAGNNVDDDSNGYVDDVHGFNFAYGNGDPMDDHFHGTHVAGTIGAVGDNGVGVAGVTWNVKLAAVKFLDSGGGGTLSGAVEAIRYAVAIGAHISNNSWGGGGFDQVLHDAIAAARDRGHIFVAAAGNDGSNNDVWPFYPATYELDNVVSVAATDHDDQLAYFSNYGATTVDLAAPGVDVLSTFPATSYSSISGTSMAAPHVTGVLALVRDLHPDWTYTQVINQVLGTVDPLANLQGVVATAGRLNAAAAVGNPVPDTTGPRVTAASPSGTVAGPVSRVRLTFSEAVTGFDAADVLSFSGPLGPVTGVAVTEVPNSGGRRFDVTFDPQSEPGAYSFSIRPDIFDLAGNAMDQDRDGIGGETPDDQYAGSFTIADGLTFPSDDVPAPIQPFTVTVSYLTIDQDFGVLDVNAQLNISFPTVGDLYVHLVSPDGVDVPLSGFNGGFGADFADTTFDDEADTPIGAGAPPYAGSFRPDGALSQFDGRNARGTWQLWVENWGWESGTINAWSLTFEAGPINLPPVAENDSTTTPEETPVTVAVLANDSDPDGDPLRVTTVTFTSGGTAVINADGSVTFTPDADYNGQAAFGYLVSDGRGGTDDAVVNVEVTPVNDAPVAGDDSATTPRDTPVTFNGFSGSPPRLEANDADVDGDALTVQSVQNAVNGTAALNADGTVTFTPAPGFAGTATFEYVVSDGQLTDVGLVTIDVIQDYFYLTTTAGGTLTGTDGVTVSFADADILRLTVGAGGGYGYRLYFDGSDVGLTTTNEDIDAFTFLPDGRILVSTVGNFSVPRLGGGTLGGGGEDLIAFTAVSLGVNTSGGWTMYFDGSDVGLTGSNENVDAVARLADGRLLISTAGAVSVPGVSGADTDLLRFTPSSLGGNTAGTWAVYFDGSDVGLADNTAEDVDALFVGPAGASGHPALHLSTRGNFSVPGLSGTNDDVFTFTPSTVGSNTAGTYTSPPRLAGAAYGLAGFDIDGVHVGLPPGGESGGPVTPPTPPPPLPPPPTGAAMPRATTFQYTGTGTFLNTVPPPPRPEPPPAPGSPAASARPAKVLDAVFMAEQHQKGGYTGPAWTNGSASAWDELALDLAMHLVAVTPSKRA